MKELSRNNQSALSLGTQKNIKLKFFKTGSFPKSYFLYKIAEFKFVLKYSKYSNNQTKMTDSKIPKNITKILQN